MTPTASTPQQRKKALIAVVCATLIQITGQILIKQGADQLPPHPSLLQSAIGMVTVPPLFFGYALYGVFTIIMVLALRHAELSVLYPILSLGYIGVPLVSVLVLHEPINGTIIAGIATIVLGVAVVGLGETKRA